MPKHLNTVLRGKHLKRMSLQRERVNTGMFCYQRGYPASFYFVQNPNFIVAFLCLGVALADIVWIYFVSAFKHCWQPCSVITGNKEIIDDLGSIMLLPLGKCLALCTLISEATDASSQSWHHLKLLTDPV